MLLAKWLTGVALVLASTGCVGSGAGPLGLGAVIGDRNPASAEPLFSKAEEQCLGRADQLLSLIYGDADRIEHREDRRDGARHNLDVRERCAQIRRTFRAVFRTVETTPRYDAQQRNEIMDALIATSNRKCTRYVALLKNADGVMNASLSLVGAILTGGLGSFVGGAATAKALAGTASIFSGSRAATNEAYLSNQTIQVLAAAFEKARRDQRRIITNRQQCSVVEYTLMRGVEDAMAYHHSCSLVAGLAETARSIERSENPGLDVMRTQFAELANLRRQASELALGAAITPVAPAPAQPSLEALVAADKALTASKETLKKAEEAEVVAQAAVTSATAALAADATAGPQLAQAKASLAKATAARLKAQDANIGAGRVRDAEVAALVQITPLPAGAIEPETRICPYRLNPGISSGVRATESTAS